MEEPEERCADCSFFCFQKGHAKSCLEEFELYTKMKKIESAINIIPRLLANNSHNCPNYILVYIEKLAEIIKNNGADQSLVKELAITIKREFCDMGQNSMGWSEAQETIKIIKNYFPELEIPLRECLHKNFSDNTF